MRRSYGVIAASFLVCSCGNVSSNARVARTEDGGPQRDAAAVPPSGSDADARPQGPPPSLTEAAAPLLGATCSGTDDCPGQFALVSVPVATPNGVVVFDHVRLNYAIGFDRSTIVALTIGDQSSSRPILQFNVPGTPLLGEPAVLGAQEAFVSLQTCDGLLETKGTVDVGSHGAAMVDGGYTAHLNASLSITSPGWHLDSTVALGTVCQVFVTR